MAEALARPRFEILDRLRRRSAIQVATKVLAADDAEAKQRAMVLITPPSVTPSRYHTPSDAVLACLDSSDNYADPEMNDSTRADMQQWTGCIAGALTEAEFRAALNATGFTDSTRPGRPVSPLTATRHCPSSPRLRRASAPGDHADTGAAVGRSAYKEARCDRVGCHAWWATRDEHR